MWVKRSGKDSGPWFRRHLISETEYEARASQPRFIKGRLMGRVKAADYKLPDQFHVARLDEPISAQCWSCGAEHTRTLESLEALVAGLPREEVPHIRVGVA
jgi:hypothetical protein